MPLDRTKYLSREDTTRLREFARQRASEALKTGHVQPVRQWLIIDMALSTGLRSCELAAIQIEDIDWQLPGIWITRRKKRKPNGRVMLPISKDLTKHLQKYFKWEGRWPVYAPGPVFLGQKGPMGVRGLAQNWKAVVKKCGLPDYYGHIHVARHTCGKRLYEETKDLVLVQEHLGHESPKTTTIYASTTFEERQIALDKMY